MGIRRRPATLATIRSAARRDPMPRRRRGTTLLLVLWTIGVVTLLVLGLQLASYRQASAGRGALGEVRARWAARAGVETVIAYLAWDVENATDSTPGQLRNDLEELAEGELVEAAYQITHARYGEIFPGPADAHAKLGINTLPEASLLQLEDMTEPIAAAILDWIDEDDEPREGGAEAASYRQRMPPYEPRNGPIRSLAELELVEGVEPELLRGEDWNLNFTLDASERDGDLSWPPDNGDEYLDGGWSDIVTARSRTSELGRSGEPLLELRGADPLAVAERLRVDASQAQALVAYATQQGNRIENLLVTPLSQISQNGTPAGEPKLTDRDLTRSQFETLFAEVRLIPPAGAPASGGGGATGGGGPTGAGTGGGGAGSGSGYGTGRVNLNTAPAEVLEYLPGVDRALAEAIVSTRESRREGLTSIMDLLDIPGIDEQQLVGLVPLVDVRSGVYVVTSRGLSRVGRVEVELVVTVDRTSLPVTILDVLER